jgi:hypothetical protein
MTVQTYSSSGLSACVIRCLHTFIEGGVKIMEKRQKLLVEESETDQVEQEKELNNRASNVNP